MTKSDQSPPKSYRDGKFLGSPEARTLRILAEYIEPESRLEDQKIRDTIVFFGSARISSAETAEAALNEARKAGQETDGDVKRARRALEMSRYYEDTRELARRLTEWSKNLEGTDHRFVICSGGGPGIMEAANRGASEAKGNNVGLNISLPHEQAPNPYITRKLSFQFHYFFMRKFWFAYLAKALVVMPGGFGTLDELMEIMTLIQTGKIAKRLPIVLFGGDYWDKVLNLDVMADYGTIAAADTDLLFRTDSVDDAFEFITSELAAHALGDAHGTM